MACAKIKASFFRSRTAPSTSARVRFFDFGRLAGAGVGSVGGDIFINNYINKKRADKGSTSSVVFLIGILEPPA